MRRWLGALLRSPRARWLVPLIACVLVLPSVTNGLDTDDLVQRWKAQGAFGDDLGTRLDLFSFWPGDAAGAALFRDLGYTPWFAEPDFKLSFFRPISALSAFVDHTVLDGLPWLMHLESIALYGLLVALVAALYRRFLPVPVAMLAALLFAIDDAHGYPVGWLANRNAILATLFGVLALWAHDRWRRDGWRAGALLGPAAFAAALLSAEFGVGALGYLVAHALFLDGGASRLRRGLAVAPYLGVFVVWQLGYRALGYGAHGSGWYVDPFAELGHFLQVIPERAVSLLLAAYAAPPSDAFGLSQPPVRLALTVLGVVILAAIVWVLYPAIRRDKVLRFFAAGSLLALVPVLPALPADRLLFFVGLGAFGVIGRVLGDLAGEREAGAAAPARPRRERVLRFAFVAVHLVLAPIVLPIGSMVPGLLQRLGESGTVGLAQLPPHEDRLLVMVNLPNAFAGMPLIFGHERRVPQRTRILATAGHPVELTREDARTVSIVIDEREDVGPLLTLFRAANDPLRVGDAFDVPQMHAEVTKADAGGTPRGARFRFEVPLEDASLLWVAWDGKRLVPFALPPVGAKVTVGAP